MSAKNDPRAAKEERQVSDRLVLAIAKKEFMEYTRRPWILLLSALFVVLVLGAGWFLSSLPAAEAGNIGFVATIGTIRGVVGLLIPIIAIILAHSAIAGEQESGSLGLLLSHPVRRGEVVLGKFIGLFGVLAGSILLGFGAGAITIAMRADNPEWGDFGRFLVATLLYTAAYLALFLLFSAIANRRTPALLYALGVWAFFGLVFETIMLALILKFGTITDAGVDIPTWIQALNFFSIPNLYDELVVASSTAFREMADRQGGFGSMLPFIGERWAAATVTIALSAWVVLSLALTNLLVGRKDV